MSFEGFQEQVSGARDASEARRLALKAARQTAGSVRRKIASRMREVAPEDLEQDPALAELHRQEIRFDKAVNSGQGAYAGALRDEWAVLRELSQFTNPIENISALADDCPILLFPLRLETRFKKVEREGEQVDQLWVRVFPDEIAINSFESDLSETEIHNAQSYWLARWKAGQDVDGQRGAWRALSAAHGPGRAYWLISNDNYVPLNLADEPKKGPREIILAIGTEEPLAEPERGHIRDYWRAIWKASSDAARLERAEDRLRRAVGEQRATELVKAYRPANIADPPPQGVSRQDTAVRVAFVIFKKSDELEGKLHAWSQPPTAGILPERFVFLAFQGDEPAFPPVLGNLVPPQLVLGPDPAAEEGEEFRLASKEDAEEDASIREGDLIVAENMRWMFDFDEAVDKGMGFRIDLTPEQAASGFDRVFVLGLKLGASKEKGQSLLEELFAQHHSSRKGLAIIRQGTPTNNTEEDGSGYSWRHDPDDSFDIYFDDSGPRSDPSDWFGKTDGRWLAELLGIDPALLQAVENYYSTDIAEARAMQRALWPATLGHFMDSMMNPVFTAEHIEQTRVFFTRYVSGRGALPAIRVGKQPYGILPATNYRDMEWFKGKSGDHDLSSASHIAGAGSPYLAFLYQILMDIDQTWMGLHRLAAHVNKAGDPHQILLDIVGLHPDSVELQKRYANTIKQIHNLYNATGFAHSGFFTFFPSSYTTAAGLLARYGYAIDAEHTEPEILKKTFFKNSYFLSGDRIDRVPNSEVDPIGIYTTDDKNYIQWLIEAAEESHDRLRLQEGFLEDRPPAALLYLLLHHALDLSYLDTSLKLHLSRGVLSAGQVKQAYVEPDFIHIQAENETESRWKYLYKSEARITDNANVLLGQYIARHLNTLDEAAAFRDVLAGLRMLQDVPTARLERVLMEHIDTVSYRHDAWILGFLHLQLELMRGLRYVETESPARQGIYIGAYGWLEDLRPENKRLDPVTLPGELGQVLNPDGDLVEDASNAGYILAPSQNHAVTAAVLRNGHLSTEDPEDKEELKIKLSSERVRLALQIIEGIQAGQSLAALLGYQFERGLHDRTDAEVDEFIFELRNAFPLVAKKFKDTAPGADDTEYEAIDQIEARNVMDGAAFLEHIQESGRSTYPFGLDAPPFNLSMPTASDAQASAMNDEVLELIEINDAVADLALAESVHQVVLGNYERAAATLDTYSKGNFPPTPEVIKTPRSGTALTQRVALQFKSGLSHHLTDPGVTPRMVAEPAIHDWLTGILPAMDQIECLVSYFDWTTGTDAEEPINLSQLGLSHIDTLYLLNIESEQALSALDDLIVRHVLADPAHNPDMGAAIRIDYTRKQDAAKFTIFEITSLIASLRALLLKSKSLTPADAMLANEAARENEQTVSLDPGRIAAIATAVRDFAANTLSVFLADLAAIVAADNVVQELDGLADRVRNTFTQAASYGMAQSGSGFAYQWQQNMFAQLHTKLEEVISRWQSNRDEYILLRNEYTAGVGSLSEEELFRLLARAELKIASRTTTPRPATLGDYFTLLETVRFAAFQDFLNLTILPKRSTQGVTDLIEELQDMAAQLPPFDIAGLDLEDQLKQVGVFAADLSSRLENLRKEMVDRANRADQFLASAAATGDPLARVELVKDAARMIFGDDFVMVPEFTLDPAQGTELQSTLLASAHSLRYLTGDLDLDFPMDDWLYGLSRVREKLYHLENTVLHIEGFTGATLELVPSQFPYRPDDFWLGMDFPDLKPGTGEPFRIEEDKLLFTAIYTEPFDPARPQCGLLLDEWTEVIPSLDETLGLAFHYDQPNSEPPQTLLLVTPSRFTGQWRWEDLVDTLRETLDMARKRAVEPDHVDGTVYSRFLPPIVSLASPLPLTPALNLAANHQVLLAKVFDDE